MRPGGIWRATPNLLAVLVTIWLCSHMFYLADEGYRSGLRLAWRAKHGGINYSLVLTRGRMEDIHGLKKRDFLVGHRVAGTSPRPWKEVEDGLELALLEMFQRNDPMKAWELKRLGSAAWQNASHKLKSLRKQFSPSPSLKDTSRASGDMTKVLVYNRVPKSGSTTLLELLYSLSSKLGYLVVRGKYHSYKHFKKNDRAGLGYFLSQASSRARMVYVQHQYYVNYTQPPTRLQQPVYINMMRDPVDHLLSSYYYKRTVILQHRAPDNLTKEEARIMQQPFEQCVVERRLECVYHGYTVHTNKQEQLDFRATWSPTYLYPSDVLLYFCGHDEECKQLGNPLALQKAKHNVDTNFAVVGLLENLEESLAVLEHRLPDFFQGAEQWYKKQSKGGLVRNLNTIKSPDISKELRKVMRGRLGLEYELYQFVKQKLFKQFEEINSVKLKGR